LEPRDQDGEMRIGLDTSYDRFQGSTIAMPKYDDQLTVQVFGHVLQAGVACVIQRVAGGAYHEQVTQAAVEDHFGWNA
jgi:hypothetical protein